MTGRVFRYRMVLARPLPDLLTIRVHGERVTMRVVSCRRVDRVEVGVPDLVEVEPDVFEAGFPYVVEVTDE